MPAMGPAMVSAVRSAAAAATAARNRKQTTGTGSSKFTAAGLVVDAATNAVASDLANNTMDMITLTDSNGFIDTYGWARGFDEAMGRNAVPMFAGQLSGASGVGGRGGTTNSTNPTLTGWTVGDDSNGFGGWGIHQSAQLLTGTFSSDVFFGQLRSDIPVSGYTNANLLLSTQPVFADLYYMRYATGAGEHRHASRRDVSNGLGGGSTVLNAAALTGPDDIVKNTRTIPANGANTQINQSGAFGGAWGQSYTSKCGIAAYRFRHQTRTAGISVSLVYQGGGTTQYDVATAIAIPDKITSYQWYMNRLRDDQIALGKTPSICVVLTHAVNDAGSGALSVDGVNQNWSRLGYKANTMQIIDFCRDNYPGAASELHFWLVPGFAMEDVGVGKDGQHQEILQGASEIATDEARCNFYDFRTFFPASDMAASGRWRTGGADKNHLDTNNGYIPMAEAAIGSFITQRAFS